MCPGSPSCAGGVWDKTGVEFLSLALLCALLPIHVFCMRLLMIGLLKPCKAQPLGRRHAGHLGMRAAVEEAITYNACARICDQAARFDASATAEASLDAVQAR